MPKGLPRMAQTLCSRCRPRRSAPACRPPDPLPAAPALQLRHRVTRVVRHPDVGPVEGHPLGSAPAANVPRVAPLLACSLITFVVFATQMLAPSKATPNGSLP